MQSPKQEMINFRKNNKKPDKKKNFVHFNQPQNILTEIIFVTKKIHFKNMKNQRWGLLGTRLFARLTFIQKYHLTELTSAQYNSPHLTSLT
jgi:hypothetical protein